MRIKKRLEWLQGKQRRAIRTANGWSPRASFVWQKRIYQERRLGYLQPGVCSKTTSKCRVVTFEHFQTSCF